MPELLCLKNRPQETAILNTKSFGYAWQLRAIDVVLCCQFPRASQVHLNESLQLQKAIDGTELMESPIAKSKPNLGDQNNSEYLR